MLKHILQLLLSKKRCGKKSISTHTYSYKRNSALQNYDYNLDKFMRQPIWMRFFALVHFFTEQVPDTAFNLILHTLSVKLTTKLENIYQNHF